MCCPQSTVEESLLRSSTFVVSLDELSNNLRFLKSADRKRRLDCRTRCKRLLARLLRRLLRRLLAERGIPFFAERRKKLFARLCFQSTTHPKKCHAAGRAAPHAAPSGAAAPRAPAARAAHAARAGGGIERRQHLPLVTES